MEWLYVIVSGFCEVMFVNYMNVWQLKRKKLAIVKMCMAFGMSLFLLHLAMRVLPMSVTYAVWTGMGAVGGVGISIIKYGESADWRRLICIAMIIFAVVGLKLTS